jgi:murein L,D-transpeptidase YcbB/YkuD
MFAMFARRFAWTHSARRFLGFTLILASALAFSIANFAAEPQAADPSSILRSIIAAGSLSDLRWPDFSDYRSILQSFYEPGGYQLGWVRNGEATPQALAVINALKVSDLKGLTPDDYDAARWADRLGNLQSASPEQQAHFDAALSVCAMRYISDLRIGKINPQHFKFNLNIGPKKLDLAEFLRARIVDAAPQNIQATVDSVEPPFAGYNRTKAALQRYLDLAKQDDGEKLPVPAKTIAPGDSYAGTPRLARFLRLLGDLPAGTQAPQSTSDAPAPESNVYAGPLVDAVKHYQVRHGLDPDGRLGAGTVKQLNVPIAVRAKQLELTLERWRWVPYEFTQPPIVVNIPEFRLRAYGANGKPELSMNVIVGKSYRHQTPVFERDMKYVVFRPYWNVPISIQRSEIVSAVVKNRNYISQKNYEVTTPGGQVVTSGAISDEVLEQLRSGKLFVRQKPGPTNALGLVKLIFPNEYNVYLHSTPSQQLFSQSRRDFSHGCIRVEKPADLAAWALRNNAGWDLARVQAAMQTGKDNVQVNLAQPILVLILYGTAVVDEDGTAHFFDDIYGNDATLEKALAKGYPYPG